MLSGAKRLAARSEVYHLRGKILRCAQDDSPAIRPSRTLAAFVVVNLVLLAALVWSLDDPLVVRVDLAGDTPVAEIEGTRLVSPAGLPSPRGVGLYLEEGARARADTAWRQLLDAALSPWLWLDAVQGWHSIALTSGDQPAWTHEFPRDGMAAWHDDDGDWGRWPLGDATSPWSGFLGHDTPDLRGSTLEAVLERGHEGAGLVVGGDGERSGLLLLFRPLHRDVMWWQLHNGQWQGPLAGASYVRPWYSALKDLVRHLVRPYFLALALVGAFAGVGVAVRLAMRRPAEAATEGVPMPSAVAWPIVGAVALATFGATGFIADALLERMPHVQDSVAYLFQAKVFVLGRLWAPLPALPEFFWHEFIVMRGDQWFAKYSPGFPAILSLGVLAGAPWLVNPIAATLAVLATYAIGARTVGRGTGLLAALLLALSPFFLFLAGSFMAHTTGLLFAALFALAYVEADRDRRWAALLAGLAVGVDLLIRPWSAACIAAPFGLDLLGRLRRAPRSTLWLIGLMALGAAPMIAVYLSYNWILAGSPFANTMELWWSFDRIGFGPDKGIAGHTPLNGLYNSLRNLSELARHAFGWPAIATFALAFVPFAAGRAGRWERLWLASWFALMIGYLFWWADGVMYGPRFYHEAMPFVVLLTARGLVRLASVGRWPGGVLAWVLLASLVSADLGLYLPSQLPMLAGYNYVSSASLAAVERAGIHHAIVFTDPGPPAEWWNYGMVFSANSPLLDTDVIYARDLGVADEKLMALYPDRRFYRLNRTLLAEIHPGDSP